MLLDQNTNFFWWELYLILYEYFVRLCTQLTYFFSLPFSFFFFFFPVLLFPKEKLVQSFGKMFCGSFFFFLRGGHRRWHYCHLHNMPVEGSCIMYSFLMWPFIRLAWKWSLKGKWLRKNQKQPCIYFSFCFRLKGSFGMCFTVFPALLYLIYWAI